MRSFLLAILLCGSVHAADLAPIKKWIAGQDKVHTVQADFTQTRSLRALRDPAKGQGKFWYSASGPMMRWEVGDPPKMLVLRKGPTNWVITPGKKRAETSPAANKPGRGAMMVPTLPLAKDFESFTKQFEVLSIDVQGRRCHFEVLPRDPQAQKYLAAIKIDFDTDTGYLIAFEIATRDGAMMRNEFTNVRMNEKLPAHIFDYDLTDFEVTDAAN